MGLWQIDATYLASVRARTMFAFRWFYPDQSGVATHSVPLRCLMNFVHAVVFSTGVVVVAKWGLGFPAWESVIAAENGPVERMSAAIWFMGFVWGVAAAYLQRKRGIEWLSIALFLLLFGLRELDAHIWSTGWNLDKLANYWNPQYPLHEKLIVLGLMVLPCLIVGFVLCVRFWQTMIHAWRTKESWLWHLLLGVIVLVFCLTIDKVGPYVLPLIGIGKPGQVVMMVIEEFLELVLGVFAIVSLWPYLRETFHCSN